jgi:hypothetical protein
MLSKYFGWLMAATIALCAALYWPALHGSFLFDDFSNLSALTSIGHVSSWRDLGIYLSQARSFPGRPLSMLSFLLQKSDWPGDPFPFKLVNLGLHLLCGVLVYRLVLRLAKYHLSDKFRAEDTTIRAQLAALLASAAWLLSPIQLSGVVLVVQRMTLLTAFFVLLGLMAYLRGLLDDQIPIRRRACWMLLGLAACMALSFLCKENGILLPVYALALDATVFRLAVHRLPAPLQRLRRLLIWPVVVFVFGYLAWLAAIQWSAQGSIQGFTLVERLLTEPRVLLSYLGKIFLPRFGLYGLYHDNFVVSQNLFSPWTTLPSVILLIGSIALALVKRRQWPLLALAILWYLGGQVIESSSVMLELYFEHRNYVPLIGIVALLAIGIVQMPKPGQRHLALTAFGIWLVASCITTTLSAKVYASEDRLASTWASSQPYSIRAQNYLAERLVVHGQFAKALRIVDKLAVQHPRNSGIAESRMVLLCMLHSDTAVDARQLDTLLQSAPLERSGFVNMGPLRVLAAAGRCRAFDDTAWLRAADALLGNPSYVADGIAAGMLHYQKHLWAVRHGQLDMALHELDETYRVDPDANAPRLKAQYLVSAGLYDQAIAVLRDTDYSRLPLLRRLLVNDRAINAADIAEIENLSRKAAGEHTGKAG